MQRSHEHPRNESTTAGVLPSYLYSQPPVADTIRTTVPQRTTAEDYRVRLPPSTPLPSILRHSPSSSMPGKRYSISVPASNSSSANPGHNPLSTMPGDNPSATFTRYRTVPPAQESEPIKVHQLLADIISRVEPLAIQISHLLRDLKRIQQHNTQE